MRKIKIKRNALVITMIIKYLFVFVLSVLCLFTTHTKRYSFVALLELLFVFFISNLLLRFRIIGQIVNDLLILLINAQLIVLLFANSYINLILLSNTDSLEDLVGKAFIYILGVSLVIIVSFLPIQKIKIDLKWSIIGIILVVLLEGVFIFKYTPVYSPYYAYIDLIFQKQERDRINKAIEEAGEKTHLFYKKEVGDFIEKPDGLSAKPNIVLIMTEGISQNIIEDDRNIMPNVSEFQRNSITMDNYFNHTFATYRGIIGQLYSGYQKENYDTNTLVSIQEILQNNGYYTCFINTEPNNKEFSIYLENLGFDEVDAPVCKYRGAANSLSDKQAYDELYDVIEKNSQKDQPFFIVIYTFGTHASLDSVDEQFEDGSVPMLNKFYDSDFQFGEFFDKYSDSAISDNTILFYTGDHCTYGDQDFSSSFSDHPRYITLLDEMPLSIWYKGCESHVIDVNGKNSLDLAPTILDMVDIDGENYFLGTSLFDEDGCYYETLFECTGYRLSTAGGTINELNEEEDAVFLERVQDYFTAKTQD